MNIHNKETELRVLDFGKPIDNKKRYYITFGSIDQVNTINVFFDQI